MLRQVSELSQILIRLLERSEVLSLIIYTTNIGYLDSSFVTDSPANNGVFVVDETR